MKKNKGFTLIELLAIVVILATLVLLLTPQAIGMIEKSRKKTLMATAENILKAANLKSQETFASGSTCYSLANLNEYIDQDISEYEGYAVVNESDGSSKIWLLKENYAILGDSKEDMFVTELADTSLFPDSCSVDLFLVIVPNGGVYDGELVTQVLAEDMVVVGTPTRAYHRFDNWTVTGLGSSITDSVLTIGTADTRLSANWTKTHYKLSFNLVGGVSNSTYDAYYEPGEEIYITDPIKSGATFSGWTVSGTGASYNSATKKLTMGSTDTNLMASWETGGYKLTTVLDGGSTSQTIPDTLKYSQTATLPIPEKDNCLFLNWEVTGTNATYDVSTRIFTMGTSDATITANWLEAGALGEAFAKSSSGTESWTATNPGYYRIEAWGAAGNGSVYGGYAAGTIFLEANTTLYVYVGGAGSSLDAGYNGGGAGSTTCMNYGSVPTGAGGGASDVRLLGGEWNNALSLNSRILVAGGGGGKRGGNTGYGGGLSGYSSNASGCAAGNQTTGSSFGGGQDAQGGYNVGTEGGYVGTAGAGGGYYGGRSCGVNSYDNNGGSGGSSFISGHTGCVAIVTADDTNNPRIPRSGCSTGIGNNWCSLHYSHKVFTNTVIIDGAGYAWTNVKGARQQMPNPAGGYYALGRGQAGDGYVKITYLGVY